MINQEFKAQSRIYQVLPDFWICCKELGELKVASFAHACAASAPSRCAFYVICERSKKVSYSNFNMPLFVILTNSKCFITEGYLDCRLFQEFKFI